MTMAKKKAGSRKTAKKKSASKRKPNAAFMKPMQPSAALGAVIGGNPMPRTEVTKKIWSYIKRNGLQDTKNRRMINADDKLREVFGGKRQVSMFEMTKLVNKHLR
ncbi:MAG: SWIB/MDM2 domain-containing protein [Betaproteobacteria bacterium]|nr:SWIB/MDM2 domain-containing protein [Betaproteobacteria bacterium]